VRGRLLGEVTTPRYDGVADTALRPRFNDCSDARVGR